MSARCRMTALAASTALIAGCLIGASPAYAASSAQIAKGDTAKTTASVILERAPRASARTVARLAKGTTVTTTKGDKAGWVKVTVTSGRAKGTVGYVKISRLKDVWDHAGRPVVSGTNKAGTTVRVTEKFTEAGQREKITYRWYRGSMPIKGATKRTYKVTATDTSSVLSVRVTAKAKGIATKTVSATVRPPTVAPYTQAQFTRAAALSARLTKGKTTQFAKAKAILSWTDQQRYERPPTARINEPHSPWRDGWSMISTGHPGVCQSFAAAADILMTLAGINATAVWGSAYVTSTGAVTVTTSNAVGVGDSNHAWIHFKADGTWYTAEPQRTSMIYKRQSTPMTVFGARHTFDGFLFNPVAHDWKP